MQDNFSLNGSAEELAMLGQTAQTPVYDLNLAGAHEVPTPEQLARALALPEINAPTFGLPAMHMPTLANCDLSNPGINLYSPFAPDPTLPDLTAYYQPVGLTIHPHDPQSSDPVNADPLADQPLPGLVFNADAFARDALLPDLQHPELTQQVDMSARPGDLSATALQTMHLDATYQQLAEKSYPAVFMDQSGMNTTRTRHMDLLMRGLDAQEHDA